MAGEKPHSVQSPALTGQSSSPDTTCGAHTREPMHKKMQPLLPARANPGLHKPGPALGSKHSMVQPGDMSRVLLP